MSVVRPRRSHVYTGQYLRLVKTFSEYNLNLFLLTFRLYSYKISTTGCSRKNCTKFTHHNFATVCHRVMRFSEKCSERNCLHDKGQCLNTVIKYSVFCSWQVNYLKTKLTANTLSCKSFLAILTTEECKIPVSLAISRGLFLVPGCPS